ncbi:MAG: hypothetical protein ACOY3Z_10990 [Thermodesulfobacteriota bacterium]
MEQPQGAAAETVAGGYLIRPWRDGDEAHILAAFQRVFPSRRSLAEWRRIYGDSPDGAEIMLCLAPDGGVAAQYAATVHRACCAGDEVRLGLMRDTFSVPDHRQARQGRQGLVAATYEAFVRQWTGPGRIAFGYGFPNPRHERIGRLQMHYQPFSRWWRGQCLLTAGDASAQRRATPLTVRQLSGFDRGFDDLWARESGRFAFALIRDARFLEWRFGGDDRYLCFAAYPFLAATPSGYLIFRPQGEFAWLADFLLPRDPAAALAFWQEVSARLLARGIRRVEGWCAASAPDLPFLGRLGFAGMERGEQLRPVFRCFDPGLDPEWADGHFHFSMADSDLV